MPSKRCTEEIHSVFKAAAAGESLRLPFNSWREACAGRHTLNNCRKQLRTELEQASVSLAKGDGRYTEKQHTALTALVAVADTCVIRLFPNRKPAPQAQEEPAVVLVEPSYAATDPTSRAIAAAMGARGAKAPQETQETQENPADAMLRKLFHPQEGALAPEGATEPDEPNGAD